MQRSSQTDSAEVSVSVSKVDCDDIDFSPALMTNNGGMRIFVARSLGLSLALCRIGTATADITSSILDHRMHTQLVCASVYPQFVDATSQCVETS
jgi:hypothetical protein